MALPQDNYWQTLLWLPLCRAECQDHSRVLHLAGAAAGVLQLGLCRRRCSVCGCVSSKGSPIPVAPPRAAALQVGPMQTAVTEVDGQQQMSAVKIERCRYLAESGCTGMCINLCKSPTQAFFTEQLGMPLTMTPNFEDLSCEVRQTMPSALFPSWSDCQRARWTADASPRNATIRCVPPPCRWCLASARHP